LNRNAGTCFVEQVLAAKTVLRLFHTTSVKLIGASFRNQHAPVRPKIVLQLAPAPPHRGHERLTESSGIGTTALNSGIHLLPLAFEP